MTMCICTMRYAGITNPQVPLSLHLIVNSLVVV